MSVTPIRDGVILQNEVGFVDDDTVKALEHLLEQAKAGRIISLAWVALHPDDYTSYDVIGGSLTRGFLGTTTLLNAKLIEKML